ncbi:hypothetical protein CFP65_3395 [Kitasatospora sp. MMS16-BH015]|uniref:NB-ARC domain-containing protein n=1 Tax=Kitasatospora sp. MMS16-BH015 TaxID=2018025 RepID=UPI000CA0FE7F|nr:NB-ARC domain-containing protein [Kitasatospora sp. MMS16-BH015]AUG78191.1 hypothetical protein CFP65_3395 [Kitasatospora sp. MMS16-BH015]
MSERGGQAAANGFQYQYLVTLEALLESAENAPTDVVAAVIEPTHLTARVRWSATAGSAEDPDAVDFLLVDADHQPVVAAQVKSGGPGTLIHAPTAFAALLRMVRSHPSARSYELITNRKLHRKTADLHQLLTSGKDLEYIRGELKEILSLSSQKTEPDNLSDIELLGLSRSSIRTDIRDRHELRDQLRERIRRYRLNHREGLGPSTAGRMSNHLVSEILQRASGGSDGVFTLDDFRAELLTSSPYLAHDLGAFDWGIMVGPVPAAPALPRLDLIARIRGSLHAVADGRSVASCVLLGLSGMGKTSLAASYAHDLADSYDQIFWVNAESDATLLVSFRSVHDWLLPRHADSSSDESQLRDRVRALLSSSAERWLMIIDNAADQRRLQSWLPTSGRGHVIITSTNQSGWATHPHRIDVQRLTPEESSALVHRRLGAASSPTDSDRCAASDLSSTMEHWPLALELACGYLAGCERGLDEVPRYLKKIRDLALDHRASIPAGYPETLVGAIRLALTRVAGPHNRQLPDVPSVALASIGVAAYFASRQIPVQLMLAAVTVPREVVLEYDVTLPVVLQDDPDNTYSADEVHRALRSESLVQRDEPLCTHPPQEWSAAHQEEIDDTISVNEIVQQVVRGLQERSGDMGPRLSQAALHAQIWLTAFIEHADETHLLAVLPHVQSLAEHAGRLNLSSDDIALLWGNLGGVYYARGEYEAARNAFEAELAYILQRNAPAPVLELKIRGSLAELARLEKRSVEDLVTHLNRVRVLAEQLRHSRPREVADVVANALTTLREATHRHSQGSEVSRLITEFTELQATTPTTPGARALTELHRINEVLSQVGSPDGHAEEQCRALLADAGLPLLQRVQVAGLLAESLAFQERWTEVFSALEQLEDYTRKSPLGRQSIAMTLHNIGLAAGLRSAHDLGDCHEIVTTVLRISSLLDEKHLSLDPAMPLKLKILRLLDATKAGDTARIDELNRELQHAETTGRLSADHEAGWRHLLTAVARR